MKKLLLTLALFFALVQISSAQVDFGIKAGINYNSDSFVDVKEDIVSGAKSKTGFHGGIWTRFKLPVVGLYIRPELVYTSLNSELTFGDTTIFTSDAIDVEYKFHKIDVPVLLGKKFLKVAHVFAGPSFQYILSSDLSIKDAATSAYDDLSTDTSGITVGAQFGAGLEFGNFGVDVRWERGFTDVESKLIGDNSLDLEYDTRVNQIIVGVSLKF